MLCKCGCGQETKIAIKTSARDGHVKGLPLSYIHGHNNRRTDPDYQIDKNGCWIWLKHVLPGGYGSLSINQVPQLAHRVFYERYNGTIPTGLQVDHVCHTRDNCAGGKACKHRRCVNPEHLEAKTPKENARRGNGAKLTLRQIDQIVKLRIQDRMSLNAIALLFGITDSHVSTLTKGRVKRFRV